VLLPKIDPGRNKLFFFFSQEFQRQVVQYGLQTRTVPTELERRGDFSRSYNTNGAIVRVNDPLANKTQFPGNVIPASRLSQVGQNILKMFPLPDYRDPNPAYKYNWNHYASAAEPFNRRTETLRMDYSPAPNWQLYFTYTHNSDDQNVAYSGATDGWVAGSLNFPLNPMSYQRPGSVVTLHSTNTIPPTLFNDLALASIRPPNR
jgi:hypothetical protein